jgi:hypothetical protein
VARCRFVGRGQRGPDGADRAAERQDRADDREAYAERFDFDVEAIYRDAKAREGKSNREVVALEPKLIVKVTS